MKLSLKKRQLILVVLASLICIFSVHGQQVPPNMGDVNQGTLGNLINTLNKNRDKKFVITLTNNNYVFQATSELYTRNGQQYIVVRLNNSSMELHPKDTRKISFTDSRGAEKDGYPFDSCWVFKKDTGKISTYVANPDKSNAKVVAISGEDGRILPLTNENLLAMIRSAETDVLDLIGKGKLVKAIVLYNEKNGYPAVKPAPRKSPLPK